MFMKYLFIYLFIHLFIISIAILLTKITTATELTSLFSLLLESPTSGGADGEMIINSTASMSDRSFQNITAFLMCVLYRSILGS